MTSLYAALEVASGAVIGTCTERHTGRLSALPHSLRLAPSHARVHVIVDNSSPHKTPDVRAWIAAHPRVHLHFTPTGASWLNVVEAWFCILTSKSVRGGSFGTVQALVRHSEQYIAHWNTHPTPFVWTREPADIIKKSIRRPRQHDLQGDTLGPWIHDF